MKSSPWALSNGTGQESGFALEKIAGGGVETVDWAVYCDA